MEAAAAPGSPSEGLNLMDGTNTAVALGENERDCENVAVSVKLHEG
jgi:hypothetical protein